MGDEIQDEEIPTGDVDGDSNFQEKVTSTPIRSYMEMTNMAVQQLAVVVGVALLAGGLYMAMIGIDLIMQWAEDMWNKHFAKKKVKDPEAPAALVGSFKRYK